MDYEQLSKFFSGELSPDEKASLLASLEADKELYDEAVRLKNSWATAQLADSPDDRVIAQQGWNMFTQRLSNNGILPLPATPPVKQKKQLLPTYWRIAAALALLIIVPFFTAYLFFDKKPVPVYQTLTVPAGQYTQLTLSDGSEIWLNACSKLVYPEKFTSNKREIQLEGEGLFKVQADKKKPFIVKTKGLNVIATGTQFNVTAYPDESQTTTSLIEGVVQLQSDNNKGYELKSGQIAVYNKNELRITVKNTDTDRQISWIHGEYPFEATSLEDITKRLERYFNVKFVFEDESLKQRKFTGTFHKSQSIEQIMLVLETSKVNYRINDNTVFIK